MPYSTQWQNRQFQNNNGWVNYPGADRSDAEHMRGETLYGVQNAQRAFDNVMQDRGYNPYSTNPFMQNLRQQARPMAQAFLVDAAMAGRPGSNYGTPTQGNDDWAFNPYTFAGWLNQGMNSWGAGGGQGQGPMGGGFYQRLRDARRMFPQAVQAVRDAASTGSGDVYSVNPYLETLSNQFMADEGQGAVGAYQLLSSPLLSPTMRQAYGSALDRRFSNSLRSAYSQSGDVLSNDKADVFRYMFGF